VRQLPSAGFDLPFGLCNVPFKSSSGCHAHPFRARRRCKQRLDLELDVGRLELSGLARNAEGDPCALWETQEKPGN
jgi:hypothetical protein